jgi:thioredoxin reductase
VPGAAEHALLVRQWSDDVIFFPHTGGLSADARAHLRARGIRVVAGEVSRLVVENDKLAGVELADGGLFPCAAVFIRPIAAPHADGLLTALGCALDEAGFVHTDASGQTSTPGLWAAGNVVNPRWQVITSAGSGSAAAIDINADLVQENVADAAHGHAIPGGDPFSPAMEALVTEIVLGDRRHGLEPPY